MTTTELTCAACGGFGRRARKASAAAEARTKTKTIARNGGPRSARCGLEASGERQDFGSKDASVGARSCPPFPARQVRGSKDGSSEPVLTIFPPREPQATDDCCAGRLWAIRKSC